MNQGNGGRFSKDDGAWQDGGLLVYFSRADRWAAHVPRGPAIASPSRRERTEHATASSRTAQVRRKHRHPARSRWRRSASRLAPRGARRGAIRDRRARGTDLDGLDWPPASVRCARTPSIPEPRSRLLGNEMALEIRRAGECPAPRRSGSGSRRRRGRRLRRSHGLLLPARQPRRPADPHRRRPRPVRGRSAVPPADGLRRVARETIEHFEAGARKAHSTGAAPNGARGAGRGGGGSRTSRRCTCSRTLSARRTPSTARTRTASFSATSARTAPIVATTSPGSRSSPASRTTSWRTRPRTPSSTACAATSSSRPTWTFRRSTRPSPIWPRSSGTFPTRRCCRTRCSARAGVCSTTNCPSPARRHDRRGRRRRLPERCDNGNAHTARRSARGTRSSSSRSSSARRPDSVEACAPPSGRRQHPTTSSGARRAPRARIDPGGRSLRRSSSSRPTIARTSDLFRIFRAGGGATVAGRPPGSGLALADQLC